MSGTVLRHDELPRFGGHYGPSGGCPASGNRVGGMVLDRSRVENGRIGEQWPAIGNPGLQQQGGMPAA